MRPELDRPVCDHTAEPSLDSAVEELAQLPRRHRTTSCTLGVADLLCRLDSEAFFPGTSIVSGDKMLGASLAPHLTPPSRRTSMKHLP